MYNRGNGLALVVRTRAFTAEGWGSVPGGRNKVPQGVWCRQKQKRANWLCNRMAEWVGEWSVCCIKESNASEGNSAGLLFPDYSDIKAPHFFFLDHTTRHSSPGIEPVSPAVEAQSPNHQGIPKTLLLKKHSLFYSFIYFIFDCAESLLLHELFSSCGEWGLLSRCVQVSYCGWWLFSVVEHRP